MIELYQTYRSQVAPELQRRMGYKNPLEVPRPVKIVLNMGVGTGLDRSALEQAAAEMGAIAGQRPVITRARKSIAGFKLREGNAIGCMVTLRGERMWSFLERLVSVALPRVRDFRGVSPTSFDGRGNYSLGITDQTIFPEIDLDKVKRTQGFDITIVTSAKTDAEAIELLRLLGMPFRRSGAESGGRAAA